MIGRFSPESSEKHGQQIYDDGVILCGRAVDLVKMSELMQANGYKNVRLSAEHLGIPFQIVAQGKAGLNKLTVLVRYIKDLNEEEATKLEDEFLRIDKQSRKIVIGRVFLYCLMADKVEIETATKLLNRLYDYEHKLTTIGTGGGAMIIVEVSTGRIASQNSTQPGVWPWRLNRVLPELLNMQGVGPA
jgi:hypothetical protein